MNINIQSNSIKILFFLIKGSDHLILDISSQGYFAGMSIMWNEVGFFFPSSNQLNIDKCKEMFERPN